MHLAFCDDEKIQLDYMGRLAEKWARETKTPLQFSAYLSGPELLFEHMAGYPFDLLMLDIDMKDMDGMALAREIRKKDEKLPILFLTNRTEYVFEGYEVNALRYVLKPLCEEKLYPIWQEVKEMLERERRYLVISVSGESLRLYTEDILYLEANGHYVTVHTGEEVYEVKKSLTELEREIGSLGQGTKQSFVGTHRCFLVNLSHVERVLRTECFLSDGSAVPVSRNSYRPLNEAFLSYYIRRDRFKGTRP